MIPSVINSFAVAEMMRVLKYRREKGARPADPSEAELNRVKRNLFGPSDRARSRAIFEREMAATASGDESRWGFDFASEKPSESGVDEYSWEPVRPVPKPPRRLPSRLDKQPSHSRQTLISDFMGKRKKAPEKSLDEERPEKIARTTSTE